MIQREVLLESFQCSHHHSREHSAYTFRMSVGSFVIMWYPVLLEAKRVGGDGGLVAKSCRTLATPWTVAHQAPLPMGFPRQEYWSDCHFLLQGIFLTQRLNLCFLHWPADSIPLSHQGSPKRVGADCILSGWCIGESDCADDGDPLRVAEMVVSTSCRCGKPRCTQLPARILIFIFIYLFGFAGS